MNRPYSLAHSTWKTVDGTPYDLAVLPWGSTEAHNYHLPYSTDTVQAEWVAQESARRAWDAGARVIVLPAMPYGVQTNQLDIKLCVNVNPSTQAALLGDIVAALEQQRIEKLLVLNGHGGNEFRGMIRELQPRTRVFLAAANWYQIVDPKPFFQEPGDHAGELETSVMQHIAPDLVAPLTDAGDGRERKWRVQGLREGWVWAPRHWRQVTADTGVGNPKAATAAKGKAYVEEVLRQLSRLLGELAAADLADMYE